MPKYTEQDRKDPVVNEKKYRQYKSKEDRRRRLRAANKGIKRDVQSKRARRKNWLPEKEGDWEEVDYERNERVRRRSEGDRRRIQEEAAQSLDPKVTLKDSGETLTGQIIEISKGQCQVEVGERILTCSVRGTLKATETGFTNIIAVGDYVQVSEEGYDEGVIEEVLPRQSTLVRPDTYRAHLQQVIVANADQMLIVFSWSEPPFWPELLDRYLIAAERYHLPPYICINKLDLVEDQTEAHQALQPYRALGYPVIFTSTVTGQGIDTLQTILHNCTTVLTGLSGVGKSSLLMALQPNLNLRIGDLNRYGEGRHTTTQATLIRLSEKIAVVDTAGIREFGLSGLHRSELSHYFPEFVSLAHQCQFNDCSHINEPECAIQKAVQEGDITPNRYHNYEQIYESLPE